MTIKNLISLLVLLSSIFLAGCNVSVGDSAKGQQDQGQGQGKSNRVNWESIPSEFNPRVVDTNFRTDNIAKIKMDFFGFKDDVEIVYSPSMPANSGTIRLFTVYKEQASWGSLGIYPRNNTLELSQSGSYQCSIQISNGQITKLKGGCYVKLQIILPVGVEIEVYNLNALISKRFIPVDTETFLKNFSDATWSEEKFKVIDEYLGSYAGMSKTPALSASQLGTVIEDFMHSKEKFEALRKLHSIVTDRINLAAMIDEEFSYFDREEARRIVGLQ